MLQDVLVLASDLESEVNSLRNEEDSVELDNLHRALSEFITAYNGRN